MTCKVNNNYLFALRLESKIKKIKQNAYRKKSSKTLIVGAFLMWEYFLDKSRK